MYKQGIKVNIIEKMIVDQNYYRNNHISRSPQRWPHIEVTAEVAAYQDHRKGGRISRSPFTEGPWDMLSQKGKR